MTRRSEKAFVEDTQEIKVLYDVLCITEDEKMNNDTFIRPLIDVYKTKNDEFNFSVKHIGSTTDIFNGVAEIIQSYKNNPLGSGDFDIYVYFMDYDRLYPEYYPTKSKSEAHIHLKRISDLEQNGYSLYISPSFPSISTFFFGFHTDIVPSVLSDQLCSNRSCSLKHRNKMGHEKCVICKSSELKINISTRNVKDLFSVHTSDIKTHANLEKCIKFNESMRQHVLGKNVNFPDLQNGIDHMRIFHGKRQFFSTLDVFISQFFEV